MRVQVMGIVNVTPDSFSDGGRWLNVGDAVAHARALIADGADVIDVGGESTRPGAAPVSVDAEIERVVPVIEALDGARARISVDTRKEEVARAAIAAGATVLNDVSASLWQVAADTGAGWVAMHMQGEPGSMQHDPRYGDVVNEVLDFLVDRAESARAEGVDEIWIDPGLGFGKTLEHNIALMANLERFTSCGFPVVLGASRKTFLGRLTMEGDEMPSPEDRDDASLAAAVWAMTKGAAMIRVHDVKATVRALRVISAFDGLRDVKGKGQAA
jgi:dihydropteroate synthase